MEKQSNDCKAGFEKGVSLISNGHLEGIVGKHMQQEQRFSLLFKHLYATLTTSQINQALRTSGLAQQDWLELAHYMKIDDPLEIEEESTCDWCEEREAERICNHCGITFCQRCFPDEKCPVCENGCLQAISNAPLRIWHFITYHWDDRPAQDMQYITNIVNIDAAVQTYSELLMGFAAQNEEDNGLESGLEIFENGEWIEYRDEMGRGIDDLCNLFRKF